MKSDSRSYDYEKPKRRYSTQSICCVMFKVLFFMSSCVLIALNVFAIQEINSKFENDFARLEEINDLLDNRDDSYSGETQRNDGMSIGVPLSRVLPVLRLLETVEKDIRIPHSEGEEGSSKLRKIVILGKTFIMKRDFEIWQHTFNNAGFEPIKTNKQELMQQKYPDWVGLKCLDLFDGKTHCIEPIELTTLKRYQKVSRLYGLRKTLWNKDRFCDTLSSSLAGFGPAEEAHIKNASVTGFLEFVFPCWLLPRSYKDLIRKAKTVYKGTKFIAKPTDRGEGNGINVLDTISEIAKWKELYPDNDEIVVQTYLPNPLLINQRKWDMRTYVLISSIHPLRVYMFRDGLVRFAASVYDPNAAKGGKKTAFLTNTSVNKKTGTDVNDLTWPFPKVYKYLEKQGVNAAMLWKRIERAIVQTLLSAEPAFARGFTKLQDDFTCVNCYQLLGVDVIVDDDLIPRIIEINGEPSMELSGEKGSQYDITKKSMTRDLVQLIYNGDSFARAVAKDLSKLELAGFTIGYEQLNTCSFLATKKIRNTFCLRKIDIEYLLEMKKEEQNMGGFRRIYPSKTGEFYDDYIQHLESKMPYGAQSGTSNIHRLITEMQKVSDWKANNHILDSEYFKRVGWGEDFGEG